MAYLGFARAGSSGRRRFASRSGASTSVATTQRSPGRPEPSAVVTTPRRPCAVFWTEHVGSAFSAVPADRLALIDVSAKPARRFTFGELAALTNRVANVLCGVGLERGDRVAVVLLQIPATAVAHIGAFKAGLISVPLSTLFGTDALRYRLGDSATRAVVTDAEGMERIAALDGVPDLRWIFA